MLKLEVRMSLIAERQADGYPRPLPRSTAVARHVLKHTIDFADVVPVRAVAKAVD
jgi:hypothetical protein